MKLLIFGAVTAIAVGLVMRVTPTKQVTIAQAQISNSSSFVINNAQVIHQDGRSVTITDQTGHQLNAYGSIDNGKLGRGKATLTKQGGTFSLVKWQPDKDAAVEGRLLEVREHGDGVYGKVEGHGWVQFNKEGIHSVRGN